jgi:hypothetical protein
MWTTIFFLICVIEQSKRNIFCHYEFFPKGKGKSYVHSK